jgi:hypothetical protein
MLGALATLLSAVAATVLPTSAACPSADSVAAELDRLGALAALAALGTPEVTIEGAKMHDTTLSVAVERQRRGWTVGFPHGSGFRWNESVKHFCASPH